MLSRQPCIIPGAGHFFGKWLVRQRWRRGRRRAGRRMAFGFGGERLRRGIVELRATSHNQQRRAEHGQPAPPRPPRLHSSQITDISAGLPATGWRGSWSICRQTRSRVQRHADRHSESAAQIPDSGRIALTLTRVTSQSNDTRWQRPEDSAVPTPVRPGLSKPGRPRGRPALSHLCRRFRDDHDPALRLRRLQQRDARPARGTG